MKTLLAGIVAIMMTSASYACSCPPITNVIYHVSSSDQIFIGRCTSGTLMGDTVVFEFDHTRTLMGPVQSNAIVRTHKEGSMCGYKFLIGEEYLVYCFSIDGELWTDICHRTQLRQPIIEQNAEIEEIIRIQMDPASQEMIRKLKDTGKNPQQGGPAYPPQGVVSADP